MLPIRSNLSDTRGVCPYLDVHFDVSYLYYPWCTPGLSSFLTRLLGKLGVSFFCSLGKSSQRGEEISGH